tara:strand:+ start:66 stop:1898 length:1833 start_codon:yes stop_codon:yes gene_type:complete
MFCSIATVYCLWLAIIDRQYKFWVFFSILIFLNLTNCIIAALFIPVIGVIGCILIQARHPGGGGKWELIKVDLFHFVFWMVLPVCLALIVFEMRGLSLLEKAIEMVFYQKIDPQLAGEDLVHYHQSNINWRNFIKMIYDLYFALNFNLYEQPRNWTLLKELKPTYWFYFILFIIGLWRISNIHRRFFLIVISITTLPIIVNFVIFRQPVDKFSSYILPFYIMSVATGWVYLFRYIFEQIWKNIISIYANLIIAFLTFTWWIHPMPLWSGQAHDEIFGMEGIRDISEHLEKHINPSDIILNITNKMDFHSFSNNSLQYASHLYYLKNFYNQHRLIHLPTRHGEVGVWDIRNRPLEKGVIPFYYPKNFSPKLVRKNSGYFLYYGTLDIKETGEMGETFSTPFWSFMRGIIFQKQGKILEAERSYKSMIKGNINADRGYYYLARLYYHINTDKALDSFYRAIQLIEAKEPEINKSLPMQKVGIIKKIDSQGVLISVPVKKPLLLYGVIKDGIASRRYNTEGLLASGSGKFYSKYYLDAGLLLYKKYIETGNRIFFLKAKKLLERSLEISPNEGWAKVIQVILKDKPKTFKLLKLSTYPIYLNGIREEFPSYSR